MSDEYILDLKNIICAKEVPPAIADEIIAEISALWRGVNLYIKKNHSEKKRLLHVQIYHEFQNGAEVNNLATKHDLSAARIYKIIKEQKAKVN
ncbi:MAG: Mor transcription activator family protein [Methylococcales bacterium]|nr:Mor transcription activator family protein [Methylococcales bacterium]MDD5753972.1 Mor transcription activator family protein [Methylococcales bacterium]